MLKHDEICKKVRPALARLGLGKREFRRAGVHLRFKTVQDNWSEMSAPSQVRVCESLYMMLCPHYAQ